VTPGASGGAGGRPAAFVDRDGTIIAEAHYLADPERVVLVPGAAGALARLAAAGYAVVVVTNQSGIARGLYGEAAYRAVQARLEALLAEAGVRLDGVYHCPHHPDFTGPCDCRKPATGLFLEAARALDLDLARSVFIGDRLKDVEPARMLGGTGILVRTGYGAAHAAQAGAAFAVVADLAAAVDRVLGGAGRPRPDRTDTASDAVDTSRRPG
jgi:D-glycero-D-manno-heptose 1,7-bisphosphate phosphatase